MLERQRDRVAAAARRLAREGLVIGTAGNVSERCDELIAATPTGAALADLKPEDVAVVDLEGVHMEGSLEATSELHLHLGVYRRFEAGGVVHTHAPIATALSCVVDEVPVVHYHMLLFGGSVRVAPYATFGTQELAERTLDALRDRTTALMANHGTITYAADADTAVEQTLLLEWACNVYWHARAIGSPRILDEEQRSAVLAATLARDYGTPHRIRDIGSPRP
jgi:L-fuculose-phosphate aldolase